MALFSKILCYRAKFLLSANKEFFTTRQHFQLKITAEKKKQKCAKFSQELQRTTESLKEFNNISDYLKIEQIVGKWYNSKQQQQQESDNAAEDDDRRRRRLYKQYFIYLLMDPGITDNLPERSFDMALFDVWQCFLNAIFYVGKGKAARPYVHFKEAAKVYKKSHVAYGQNDKIQRILNIWQGDCGVVCVQAFHNICSRAAHTREAAIIDAMSLSHLANRRHGQYYGLVKDNFTLIQRRLLGVALLYRVMHIYLAEGESSVGPADVLCC